MFCHWHNNDVITDSTCSYCSDFILDLGLDKTTTSIIAVLNFYALILSCFRFILVGPGIPRNTHHKNSSNPHLEEFHLGDPCQPRLPFSFPTIVSSHLFKQLWE